MSIFEADKQNLIIRQATEMYGIRPVCYGMAVSLFHNDQKRRIKPHIRDPTLEQRYQQEENRCYKVLSDYFHHLRTWKQQYAPKQPEDEWHPLFVEALQRESYIEYLLACSAVWHSR